MSPRFFRPFYYVNDDVRGVDIRLRTDGGFANAAYTRPNKIFSRDEWHFHVQVDGGSSLEGVRLRHAREHYANGLLRLTPELEFNPGCDTSVCDEYGSRSNMCLDTCSNFFVPRGLDVALRTDGDTYDASHSAPLLIEDGLDEVWAGHAVAAQNGSVFESVKVSRHEQRGVIIECPGLD